jgi:hypothetical protein
MDGSSYFPKNLNDLPASGRLLWAAEKLEAFEAMAELNAKGQLVGKLEGRPFAFDLNEIFGSRECGYAGCAIGWLTVVPELREALPIACDAAQGKGLAPEAVDTVGNRAWNAMIEIAFFLHGKKWSSAQTPDAGAGYFSSTTWEVLPFMPNAYSDQITEEQWYEIESNSEGTAHRDNDNAEDYAHLIRPAMVAKLLREHAAHAKEVEDYQASKDLKEARIALAGYVIA